MRSASQIAEVRSAPAGARSTMSFNLNVDSTSDPDKLEKQLKLLREFGVI